MLYSHYGFLLGAVLLIQGNLMGQTPEPAFPELFGKFTNVRDFAMNEAKTELYFTVESPKKEFSVIMVVEKKGKKWGKPAVASFSGQFKDLEPFLSPDGLKLYFASNRPKGEGKAPMDMDIWVVDRNMAGKWGEPKPLGDGINTEKDEFYPSVARNGNLYFTRESDDRQRKEDIFVAEWKKDQYEKANPLPDAINSNTYEFNAFITPDDNALIYTSYGRNTDLGGSDMYINHRNGDGTWGEAIHLGSTVNSNKIDYCPWWDEKEGVLYFTSERSMVPKVQETQMTWEDLEKQFGQYTNGMGRIYRIPFSIPYQP